MGSQAAASAPIFISKLLRHQRHPLPIQLVFARQTFCTGPPPRKSTKRDDFGPNPFLRSGEVGSCRVDKAENECYMRVDVPGVAEADMKVWTESGFIYFHAQGSELPEYNYQGRVFGGSIGFDKDRFDSDGVRAEVKDGVLWLLVPRVKN
ncbi:hypothetical protein RHSIM_Rhsim05G0054600 [Rhododendron simsii]|uniref:SHSP domain-containing protein n=1 Tax=Rhododendron simsii TaxID=118357 RepID=A0A834GXH5_RHOSS|nr:hypothetical protein RHSIM_Rhsim05G0054600 [Rhododendron simsii]